MDDTTLTLENAQQFCTLLSNRLPNLEKVSFNIYDSTMERTWLPSRIVDGEKKSTKLIVNLIYYLVNHLHELISLRINFYDHLLVSEKPCFPHLIRQELYQCPLSRPYRFRCDSCNPQIWL